MSNLPEINGVTVNSDIALNMHGNEITLSDFFSGKVNTNVRKHAFYGEPHKYPELILNYKQGCITNKEILNEINECFEEHKRDYIYKGYHKNSIYYINLVWRT